MRHGTSATVLGLINRPTSPICRRQTGFRLVQTKRCFVWSRPLRHRANGNAARTKNWRTRHDRTGTNGGTGNNGDGITKPARTRETGNNGDGMTERVGRGAIHRARAGCCIPTADSMSRCIPLCPVIRHGASATVLGAMNRPHRIRPPPPPIPCPAASRRAPSSATASPASCHPIFYPLCHPVVLLRNVACRSKWHSFWHTLTQSRRASNLLNFGIKIYILAIHTLTISSKTGTPFALERPEAEAPRKQQAAQSASPCKFSLFKELHK